MYRQNLPPNVMQTTCVCTTRYSIKASLPLNSRWTGALQHSMQCYTNRGYRRLICTPARIYPGGEAWARELVNWWVCGEGLERATCQSAVERPVSYSNLQSRVGQEEAADWIEARADVLPHHFNVLRLCVLHLVRGNRSL